jgi:hypothetical protein
MKFKFWQREPEYFSDEELKPKKKETFASVSDKVLIKRMKKDSAFGIEMAMRYKGLEREKPQGIKEKLKEEIELRKLFKDYLGKEPDTKGGWLSSLVDKDSVKLILSIVAKQMGMTLEPSPAEEPKQLEQETEQEVPKLAAPKPGKQVDLRELTPYLDYEPENVIKELVAKGSQGDNQSMYWISFLRNQTYDSITMQLSLLAQHPQYSAIAKELLLEQRREWIEKLLESAKTIKMEEKSD